MIVHNVEQGQLSEDIETLIELSEIEEEPESIDRHKRLVKIVTDDYNSWNILKEHLWRNPDDFESQLDVTERALEAMTKSYQAWHHRIYMMEKLRELHRDEAVEHVDELYRRYLKRDDYLTSVLLKADPRNFHCWNYRMRLFKELGSKVDCDVYNYSYLHHSCVHDPLALIFSDPRSSAAWEHFYARREMDRLRRGAYLRVFPDRIELRLRDVLHGRLALRLDGKEVSVSQAAPTKFISLPVSHPFTAAELETAELKLRLEKTAEESGFLEKVLGYVPDSVDALTMLLDYTEDTERRRAIIDELCKLDAIRTGFYGSLLNEFCVIYA
jgi:geranylgeranyl transferase type-2 subunit alpha